MYLTDALARLGRAPVSPARSEHLRSLTLTNVAAALGNLGDAARLVRAAPTGGAGGEAFGLAMRLHARTQDDFFPAGRVHVGAVTLAATLALAPRARLPLVECLAPGYEAICAVSAVYGGDAQRRGLRPTGVFAPLGAAVSAATVIGLEPEGVANAVGIAAARSGGTNQSWVSGTDEWLIEAGAAARAGVEAALMTEAGVVSSREALEGTAGWAQAFFGDAGAERLRAHLASAAPLIPSVATKPYPVSGIAQVATSLACDARTILDGRPVDSVLVRMPEGEFGYPGTSGRGPFRSRSSALMSVGFCVACGLSDGVVRLARLERPGELIETLGKVRVEPDPALADGQAVLIVEAGGERHELRGKREALLFPSWQSLAMDAEGLAARSEAPVQSVLEAVALLAAEDASPASLANLLEGPA